MARQNYFKAANGSCLECVDPWSVFDPASIQAWLPSVLIAGGVFAVFMTCVCVAVFNMLSKKRRERNEARASKLEAAADARLAKMRNSKVFRGYDKMMIIYGNLALVWVWVVWGAAFFPTLVKKISNQWRALAPKFKIIVGMFQVQDGLQMSFTLTLPTQFTELLTGLNFMQFSIPMECLVAVNFQ